MTTPANPLGADELFSLTVMLPNVQPGRIGWLTGHGQNGKELPATELAIVAEESYVRQIGAPRRGAELPGRPQPPAAARTS